MKVASVVWDEKIDNYDGAYIFMKNVLKKLHRNDVDIIVFPALIGNLFPNESDFINQITLLSKRFSRMLICPGSYAEMKRDGTYHTSFCIKNGNILWKQRQLYLARWEKEASLSRGTNLIIREYKGIKLAIILSTDVFYPQVARYAAMHGVHIVLSPVALLKGTGFPKQLSGSWQHVQQNLFFTIESGYNGAFNHLQRQNRRADKLPYFKALQQQHFSSQSLILAPLEITPFKHGFLTINNENNFIIADISIQKLERAKEFYYPIRQLNKPVYKKIF